jgi:hypothetical protein
MQFRGIQLQQLLPERGHRREFRHAWQAASQFVVRRQGGRSDRPGGFWVFSDRSMQLQIPLGWGQPARTDIGTQDYKTRFQAPVLGSR